MTTLVHRIREHALDRPGDPALYGPVRSSWRQLSWGIWWASIQQAAGGLLDLGIQPNEVVLLWGQARPEWAVVWPALCAIGARPLILTPDADDGTLLVATSEEQVRIAVTQGRDRLERVLQLREDGGLPLDRLVTLDRLDLRVPRLVDLESLIERGAMASAGVQERMADVTADSTAAILEDGRRFTHSQLVASAAPGWSRVALGVEPDGVGVLRVIATAAAAGAQLWFTRSAEDRVGSLAEIDADAICLDPSGWQEVLGAIDARLEQAEGVRGALARHASTGGVFEPLGRRALEEVLGQVGVAGVRAWCPSPLLPDVRARLARFGIDVTVP